MFFSNIWIPIFDFAGTKKSKIFTNWCKSLQNEFLFKEFWFSKINLLLKSIFLKLNGVSTHFLGSDKSSLCKLSCWGKALFKPWTTILKFLIQALIDVYDVSIAYGPIQSFMNNSRVCIFSLKCHQRRQPKNCYVRDI